MPVGATISAASTLAGSAIQSSAAKSAAKTQANAANQASQTQLDMFNTIRGDLGQYRDLGSAALPAYQRLLGLSAPAGSAASAPKIDTDAYFAQNPDALANFRALQASGRTDAVATDPQAFVADHWEKDGSRRTLPMTQAQSAGTGSAAGTGAGTFDWDTYLLTNPDVQRAWNVATAEQKAELASKYGVTNAQQFAALHYKNNGQQEGRGVESMTDTEAALRSLPGYQFARDQGIASAQRSLGSKGLTGAQLKGVSRFVTGLADQTYGEQVNRLGAAVSAGQNAANQTGAYGTQTASQIGQNQIGAGTAAASGQVGAANTIAGGLGNAGNLYLTSKLLGGGGGGTSFYAPTSYGLDASTASQFAGLY